jgi:hypothetical protein
MALEIEARDVIKIVLQFCKENSLTQTFQTLQQECQVSLNTVDSTETFVGDIEQGRWDAVLPQVAQLKLPKKKLEDLYEQIVLVSPGRWFPEIVAVSREVFDEAAQCFWHCRFWSFSGFCALSGCEVALNPCKKEQCIKEERFFTIHFRF